MRDRLWQAASDRSGRTSEYQELCSRDRASVQFREAVHDARVVNQISATWPNRSVTPSLPAPSLRATACDAVFSRSMEWMMRSISKVENDQSIAADAASTA